MGDGLARCRFFPLPFHCRVVVAVHDQYMAHAQSTGSRVAASNEMAYHSCSCFGVLVLDFF